MLLGVGLDDKRHNGEKLDFTPTGFKVLIIN